jgi:hypothetical protein
MNNGEKLIIAISSVMPDGNGGWQPVPEVMLENELIKFLRLEELGIKNPVNTLRYYRERGKLHATRIGNRNAYTRRAACEFLEVMTQKKT